MSLVSPWRVQNTRFPGPLGSWDTCMGPKSRHQIHPPETLVQSEQQEEVGVHSAFLSLTKVTKDATGFWGSGGQIGKFLEQQWLRRCVGYWLQ